MELVFGSRGSQLAIKQTNEIIEQLEALYDDLVFKTKVVKTLGDQQQDLDQATSDKQDWVQGLDTALINGEIDLAVHSAKDVPVEINPDTEILPLGFRKSFHDVFIPQADSLVTLETLPEGAKIGTSSLRRTAQLVHHRPDLNIFPHRGNINTRIAKLYDNPELDGIILAAAGIERLGIGKSNFQDLSTDLVLPAVNQGILVGQFLKDNQEIREYLQSLVDPDVQACFLAERKCIQLLDANCHSAIGVLAVTDSEKISIHARVLMPDGSEMIESKVSGNREDPEKLSEQLAEDLIVQGASRILIESEKRSS